MTVDDEQAADIDRSQWKYDPLTGRSLTHPDDVTPWEQYAFERGYQRALQVVREAPQPQWKGLSTAEVKTLWNLTKKPTEFAEMLEVKLRQKNAANA